MKTIEIVKTIKILRNTKNYFSDMYRFYHKNGQKKLSKICLRNVELINNSIQYLVSQLSIFVLMFIDTT